MTARVRRPSHRAKNATLKGEFGLQDLKNIGQKISTAAHNAGQSIKNVVRRSPPQLIQRKTPVGQNTYVNRRGHRVGQHDPNYKTRNEKARQNVQEKLTGNEESPSTQELRDSISRQNAERQMNEKRSGDNSTKQTSTYEERRSEKQRLREEKREAWRSSSKNAMNKPKESTIPEEQKPELKERIKTKAKEFAKEAVHGASEAVEDIVGDHHKKIDAPPSEDTDDKEPIKLHGTGDAYRIDQHGIVYRPSKNKGMWISTGKMTKYGIPKEVSEDTVDDEGGEDNEGVEGILDTLGVSGRKQHGSRGSRSSHRASESEGEEPKAAISAPDGIISTGVLGRRSSGASKYDERAEKERMASFDKSGSALNVGSGYISAGSYKGSGYNEQREKERMDKINRAGSPLSAGLGYISAGTYRNKNPQVASDAHLGEIDDADSFSSGTFKFSYGNKPKKPVDVGAQIDVEMAKVAQIQARQAQLQQLSELQKMQQQMQPMQPISGMQQQPQQQPQQNPLPSGKQMGAVEFLFGVKTGITHPKTQQPQQQPQKPQSATAQLFGSSINTKATSKPTNGSATADFFGLGYSNKKETPSKTKAIGEFGGKFVKNPKQIVDLKIYTPKNYMPESKGGIMGVFEKNAKLQKVDAPKRIRPLASELLFGGRK